MDQVKIREALRAHLLKKADSKTLKNLEFEKRLQKDNLDSEKFKFKMDQLAKLKLNQKQLSQRLQIQAKFIEAQSRKVGLSPEK